MDDRKQVGELGEKKAIKYLKENGYKIMQHNFKCRTGEVDIIAMDGKTIVFIEVKTRRSLSYGLPCESVTAAKKNTYFEQLAIMFPLINLRITTKG